MALTSKNKQTDADEQEKYKSRFQCAFCIQTPGHSIAQKRKKQGGNNNGADTVSNPPVDPKEGEGYRLRRITSEVYGRSSDTGCNGGSNETTKHKKIEN